MLVSVHASILHVHVFMSMCVRVHYMCIVASTRVLCVRVSVGSRACLCVRQSTELPGPVTGCVTTAREQTQDRVPAGVTASP